MTSYAITEKQIVINIGHSGLWTFIVNMLKLLILSFLIGLLINNQFYFKIKYQNNLLELIIPQYINYLLIVYLFYKLYQSRIDILINISQYISQ
jgi:hypothetical protein